MQYILNILFCKRIQYFIKKVWPSYIATNLTDDYLPLCNTRGIWNFHALTIYLLNAFITLYKSIQFLKEKLNVYIMVYFFYRCMYQDFYYRLIDSIQYKGDRVFKYENSCKKSNEFCFLYLKRRSSFRNDSLQQWLMHVLINTYRLWNIYFLFKYFHTFIFLFALEISFKTVLFYKSSLSLLRVKK